MSLDRYWVSLRIFLHDSAAIILRHINLQNQAIFLNSVAEDIAYVIDNWISIVSYKTVQEKSIKYKKYVAAVPNSTIIYLQYVIGEIEHYNGLLEKINH